VHAHDDEVAFPPAARSELPLGALWGTLSARLAGRRQGVVQTGTQNHTGIAYQTTAGASIGVGCALRAWRFLRYSSRSMMWAPRALMTKTSDRVIWFPL
jgi:hypothetical protein